MYQIGNFQPFRTTQTIRFKPINLIYGRNSSGKSAIIRSLVLLRYALGNESLDVESIPVNDEEVYLGGCENYVHRGNFENPIVFTVGDHSFPAKMFPDFRSFQEISSVPEEERLFGDPGSSCASIRLELRIDPRWTDILNGSYDYRLPKLGVETIQVNFEGKSLLRYSLPLEHFDDCFITQVNIEHPHLRHFFRKKGVPESEIARLPEIVGMLNPFEPEMGNPPHTINNYIQGVGVPDGLSLQEEAESTLDSGYDGLLKTLVEYCQAVDKELFPRCFLNKAFLHLDYLGPWRKLPQGRMLDRVREETPKELVNVWQGLLQDDDVREQVNSWLTRTERLSCPYRLEILEHEVSGLTQSDIGEIIKPHKERELVLLDKRTRTPVSLSSVGMGISQVIPVLVSLMTDRESLLCIEQPELHLHPALQAELGDVVIESGLKNGNCVIAETHSEHLLLRIMRRMRETANGSRSESEKPVTPNDVGVFYVDTAEDCSFVRELELTENGELVQDWPYGFFDDGLREVLM